MYTVDSLFQEAHPWILEFHFYFWDKCKLNESMTKIRPSRFVFSRFDAKRLNRGIGYLRTVRNLPYFRGIYVGIQRHDLCKKRVKWVMCVLNRLNEMSSTQMVGARIFFCFIGRYESWITLLLYFALLHKKHNKNYTFLYNI